MLRFAAASRPARVARGTSAMAALTGGALAAWREELTASGGLGLLESRGMYAVYGSGAAFRADAAERDVQRALGVRWELLDGAALRRRESALGASVAHAVFYPDVAHVVNPQAIVRCLEDAFVAAGGTRLTTRVTGLRCEPEQIAVTLDGQRLACRHLVIAAGLGSRDLCRLLGVNVPLAAEMGYHVRFPGAEARLRVPVAAVEHGFIVTPMEGHLRAAGTVELAPREMAPDWRRARALARQAGRLFHDGLPEPADWWRGSRPTLPDFLPAIGPLPGHPRVVAAFGHQHVGLTTATVTASLVRDVVLGGQPALDIAPYDPGRFTSPENPRRRLA